MRSQRNANGEHCIIIHNYLILSAPPASPYLIHAHYCSELEKLKAEFNLSHHTGADESKENLFHSNVLQLWTVEFDKAKKEVEAWEADIEMMQKKNDAYQTRENIKMQDAVGSGSENVHGTGEQLVMAVLQSQMDGVKINDAGGICEGEDAGTGNIDIDNEGSKASNDDDNTSVNGDGRNELHFGFGFEPSNEAINMTILDGNC